MSPKNRYGLVGLVRGLAAGVGFALLASMAYGWGALGFTPPAVLVVAFVGLLWLETWLNR